MRFAGLPDPDDLMRAIAVMPTYALDERRLAGSSPISP